MKKYLFFAACIFMSSFMAANAIEENVLTVTPVTIDAGVDISADDCGSIEFAISATRKFAGLSCYLYVPNELILENGEGTYVNPGSLLPYTTKKSVKTYDHTISCSQVTSTSSHKMDGFTCYQITVYDGTDNSEFNDVSGDLFTLDCGSASNAKGIYPIYIEECVLAWSASGSYKINWISSYVNIGNATTGTLNVKGVIPASVTSALNKETNISSLDLSNCTQINDEFVLRDGRSVILPEEDGVKVSKVSYTRAANNYNYGTICVPFKLTPEDGIKYYSFDGYDEANKLMKFSETSNVEAGVPALFYREKTSSLSASAEGTDLVLVNTKNSKSSSTTYTNWYFNGTYSSISVKKGTNYFIANDQFWNAANGVTVPAFRGYFDSNVSSQSPIRIAVGTDGIFEVKADGELQQVFNLQGQHISAPEQGRVNIVNGKKTFVK